MVLLLAALHILHEKGDLGLILSFYDYCSLKIH